MTPSSQSSTLHMSTDSPQVIPTSDLPEVVQHISYGPIHPQVSHYEPPLSTDVGQAEPWNPDRTFAPSRPWWKRRSVWLIGLVVFSIIIGVAVGIPVGLKNNSNRSTESSGNTSTGALSSTSASATASESPTGSSYTVSTLGTPTTFPSTASPLSACFGTVCPVMLAAASSNSSPNKLLFAALGSDGTIWYRTGTSSGWDADWESLGGEFYSQPAAISIDSDRFDVFAVATDNSMKTKTYRNGAWDSDWTSLGGNCISPPVVYFNGSGAIAILVTGPDHALYHKWYDSTTPWSTADWESLGGYLSSSASASTTATSSVDIVAYGVQPNGGGPYYIFNKRYSNPNWTTWDSDAGSFRGDPFIVSSNSGHRTDSFGLQETQDMWHWQWTSGNDVDGTYETLVNLGGSFASQPWAIWTSDTRLDVLAIDSTDGRLKHKSLLGSNWGTQWEDLGGLFNSAPTALMLNSSTILVSGVGPGGAIIHGQWEIGDGYLWGNGSWFTDGDTLNASKSWFRSGPA